MRINTYMGSRLSDRARDFVYRLYNLVEVPAELLGMDPQEAYILSFSPDVSAAVRTLITHDAALSSRLGLFSNARGVASVRIDEFDVPPGTFKQADRVWAPPRAVYFEGEGLRAVDTNWVVTMAEDSELYPVYRDWALRYGKVEEVVSRAMNVFNSLNDACNTPGQWKRVFPEFTMLLPENMQKVVANAERASPWPAGLDRDEFAPKIRSLAHLFARCAVLPPRDLDQPIRMT